MAVSTRSLRDALVTIAGSEAVADGAAGGPVDGVVPRWVVGPGSIDELSSVVALACEERLAVVPRGSGTAMALGHPLTRADVVVDLRRLDGILEYNPDDLTVTVGAGTTAGALGTVLHPRGQFLPVDPPGAAARTLGGMVAAGASGPLRARYGTARDLLLGVRFVQADGVATWGGSKVVKSVTGYDVPKLMVGSLGTLGILAELTLRLHPRPSTERTWLLTVASPEAAQGLVASLIDSTLQPNRMEWLSAGAARTWGDGSATAGIALSVGSVEAAVEAQAARVEALVRDAGGAMREVDPGAWLWHGVREGGANRVTLRVATLPDRLAQTAVGIERAVSAVAPSGQVTITGAATVGALRVELAGIDPRDGALLVPRLRDLVQVVDGSVVVEQGSPEFRRAVDPWGPVAPTALALMRGIKRQFDPEGILNPGRFVGGL
jgi:glycolate oxidase FAD binding subunit